MLRDLAARAMPYAWLGAVSIALLAPSASARAATRSWPGPAPCNGTLQACLDASASGDTVLIATEGPIDETLVVERAVGLVARQGFRPRFVAGRGVTYTPMEAGPWSLLISGIELQAGSVVVQVLDDGAVVLENITATNAQSLAGIAVFALTPASGTLAAQVTVRRCRVRVGTPSGFGIRVSAAPGAQLDARVHDNVVVPVGQLAEPTVGAGPHGISVAARGAAAHRIDIQRNRILPAEDDPTNPSARLASGIAVETLEGSGSSAIRLADNVTVLRPGVSVYNAGIIALLDGSANDIRILNNTLIGGRNGIRVQRSVETAGVSGRIDNNLIAAASLAGIYIIPRALEPALGNASNLVFGNAVEEFTPGPGTLFDDPRIVSAARPRLSPATATTPASPAIDAGDVGRRLSSGPGTLPTLPALDNDGLRRVKSGALDIGAFESGDGVILHNTTGFTNATTLDDPRINGIGTHTLQVTRSGGTAPAGTVPNPRPMSQRFNTSLQRWQLIADDGSNLNTSTGFSVLVPGSGIGAFTHVATAGNITGAFSQLPPAPTQAVFLISATRGADSGGASNPHPIGVTSQFGAWFAVNLDNAPIPPGTRFNVYWQEAGTNAYVHTVDAGNQPDGFISDLDHPLLNGNRCAIVHLSSNATVLLDPHHAGVRYDAARERWFVRHEDATPLPVGAQFFVVIDAAASETGCVDAVFAHGFEPGL